MPEILEGAPANLRPSPDTDVILNARRAFATAQELLAGSPTGTVLQTDVGWHDSSVNSETGSFAVVGLGAGLDDLIGEIVQVSYKHRTVLAYVLQTADVPVSLSLTRRNFAALSILPPESIPAFVVVTA